MDSISTEAKGDFPIFSPKKFRPDPTSFLMLYSAPQNHQSPSWNVKKKDLCIQNTSRNTEYTLFKPLTQIGPNVVQADRRRLRDPTSINKAQA